jgi:hypothetical protein
MTLTEKDVVDIAAASTGLMSLATWLPPTASLFTIVWLGIRIWETKTVQQFVQKKTREKDYEYRKNQSDTD